jgi:cell wall-associated NlpC family hydrolase
LTLFADNASRDSSFSFEPGSVARAPGPWTRLRRSFTVPEAAVAGAYQFNPDLNVQIAGPWTRLRRSSSELVVDLPWLPALRAAPVGAAVVGVVVLATVAGRTRSHPRADASPISGSAATPARAVEAPRRAEPIEHLLAPQHVQATLVGDKAVLPANAPPALQGVIAAANHIRNRPYSYGGGHGSFVSSGYDCSGSVSYALHGGNMLSSPLASGSLEDWGELGEGKAITIYANGGHAYAVIAGLRWDTSGTGDSGPSWHSDMRSSEGFVARHPSGY